MFQNRLDHGKSDFLLLQRHILPERFDCLNFADLIFLQLVLEQIIRRNMKCVAAYTVPKLHLDRW